MFTRSESHENAGAPHRLLDTASRGPSRILPAGRFLYCPIVEEPDALFGELRFEQVRQSCERRWIADVARAERNGLQVDELDANLQDETDRQGGGAKAHYEQQQPF